MKDTAMASKLQRTSYLARIGGGVGIGALAIVTGACSQSGESASDSDMGGDVSAPTETAAPATDSDTGAEEGATEAAEESTTDSDTGAGAE